MSRKRFQYQQQETPQTLREGWQEYLDGHPNLFREETLDGEARQMFHRHDLCHVLFGLDTIPRDEGRADLWTMMGTDVGLRRYSGYLRLPKAKAAFKSVPPWQMAALLVCMAPDTLTIYWRTRRMPRKLSWDGLDTHMERPLAALRSTYGIRIL